MGGNLKIVIVFKWVNIRVFQQNFKTLFFVCKITRTKTRLAQRRAAILYDFEGVLESNGRFGFCSQWDDVRPGVITSEGLD
jgi:hypothetical protein